MNKFIMLILSIMSILVAKSSVIHAHHYGPEFGGYCSPGMHIEIIDDTLYYDPHISVDCPLWFSSDMNNFYELQYIEIVIEHQRMIDGVWQAGPKNIQRRDAAWEIRFIPGNDHSNLGGGIVIDEYNLVDYDRYRLVVTLEGASTHDPTPFGTPAEYELRVDEYATEWIYGLNTTNLNPIIDDLPDTIIGQSRDEERSLYFDQDGDGISDMQDQCPDIAGTTELQGCIIENVSSNQQSYLPFTNPACVAETSPETNMISDIVPDQPIIQGTNAINCD